MTRDEALFRQRLLKAGGFDPGPLDGVWGSESTAANVAFERATAELRIPRLDQRTEDNIATLLIPMQRLARQHMGNIVVMQARSVKPPAYQVRIISGTRTYPEQDALYAKGRSAPGPKVTNAKGGQSNHNFGIAYDVGAFIDGQYLTGAEDGANLIYAEIARVRPERLAWGGDWRSPDRPHYELPHGLTASELRRRFEAGIPYLPN